MNHIFRTLWNEKTGTFVAVSELAKSSGKKASAVCGEVVGAGLTLKTMAASLLLMVVGTPVYALPTDGVVAAGSATISSGAESMTINQSSQNAALNWQSFSIGQGEAVQFVQPDSSSVALNRVLGADPSSILGSLSANGQVFLVNPNGILFGQDASVNVGGLVASTLNISDSDFMAGEYNFAGTSAAAVLNQGRINADGGYVALLGANVSNQGVIAARLGTVALAAGEAITLDVAGDGLLNVGIDQGAVDALVANGGMIQADGGQVLMSAQGAGNLLHTAVNNTGVIQAQTIENRDGVIRLLGDMQTGTVNVAGTLDASAANGGDGGFIETSAAHVKVADNAKITTAAPHGKTGTWLIDPTDFTVAATDPGNGSSYISNTALSTSLNSNNVTIQTLTDGAGNGDIHVNGVVSWSANNTLTLDAHRNININQSITATGASGKLALKYGQGATDGVIAGVAATYNVNAPVNLKAGYNFSTQLGSTGAVKDYTVITSLGAQGSTTKTDLQGISGGLTGNYALGGNIDAQATATWNQSSDYDFMTDTFTDYYAGFTPIGNGSSNFTGSFNGLGHTISSITINRPYNAYVGLFGIVGQGARISNLGLIDGSVLASSYTGALVGKNSGTISNSFTAMSVSGPAYVGGMVGWNSGGSISNSYALGSVTATYGGGLVGRNEGSVANSYATGSVSGSNTGGLVGYNNNGSVSKSYWNSTVNAKSIGYSTNIVTGATGLTAAQMMQKASFNDLDIANTGGSGAVWRIYEGHTAPLLTSFMTGLTLTSAPDATVTYNGAAQSGGAFTLTDGVLGAAATGTHAGFYNGYYSTQQGYDISGGNLTIGKADLTLGTSAISKTYDGSLAASGTATVSGGTLFSGDTLSGGTFGYADKNAGTGKTVTTSGVTVNDGNDGGNYNVSYADNTTSTIDPKALSVSGMLAADKPFDGNTVATLSGGSLVGLVGTETLTFSGQSGVFADANVGTDKAVTVSGIVLADDFGLASNYSVTNPQGLTADITAVETPVDAAPNNDSVLLANAIASAGSESSTGAAAGGSDAASSPLNQVSLWPDPDGSTSANMAGLGLTIVGSGIRLPYGLRLGGATDEEERRKRIREGTSGTQ